MESLKNYHHLLNLCSKICRVPGDITTQTTIWRCSINVHKTSRGKKKYDLPWFLFLFTFGDYKEINVVSSKRYSGKNICYYQYSAMVLKIHIYQFYIKNMRKKWLILASQANYTMLSSMPNTVTQQMKSFHKESIHFFDEMKNKIIINSKSWFSKTIKNL